MQVPVKPEPHARAQGQAGHADRGSCRAGGHRWEELPRHSMPARQPTGIQPPIQPGPDRRQSTPRTMDTTHPRHRPASHNFHTSHATDWENEARRARAFRTDCSWCLNLVFSRACMIRITDLEERVPTVPGRLHGVWELAITGRAMCDACTCNVQTAQPGSFTQTRRRDNARDGWKTLVIRPSPAAHLIERFHSWRPRTA